MWQYITLMKRIYLIDCPGIVPPSMLDSPEDILLRGVVRVENVENPAQYIPAVLSRCKVHHLERTYDLKGWTVGSGDEKEEERKDAEQMVGGPKSDKARTQEAVRFLEALARKGGRLHRGGEADMDGVAKMVLNDFLRGKIPWFAPPPAAEGVEVEKKGVVGGAPAGGEEVEGEGRDEKLGFTHKKRKLEEREQEDASINQMHAANEEANGLETGADEEDGSDEESEEDDFEGFDEESDEESGDAESAGGGVKVAGGESEDDESDEETT